jgi:hypothetical protein
MQRTGVCSFQDRLKPVMLIAIGLVSTIIALTLQRYLDRTTVVVAVGPVAIFGASIFAQWLERLK